MADLSPDPEIPSSSSSSTKSKKRPKPAPMTTITPPKTKPTQDGEGGLFLWEVHFKDSDRSGILAVAKDRNVVIDLLNKDAEFATRNFIGTKVVSLLRPSSTIIGRPTETYFPLGDDDDPSVLEVLPAFFVPDHDISENAFAGAVVIAQDKDTARSYLDTQLEMHGLRPYSEFPYTLQKVDTFTPALYYQKVY